MSSSDSLTPKTHPRIKLSVASYHTTKVIAHQTPKPVIATASQNWLPWQRPSAPMDPHPTHDSYSPSEPTTQTASLSVQPSMHRRPYIECPYTLQWDTHSPLKFAPSHGGTGPHLIHCSPGPPKSSTQKAARSVQPFLQDSLV